MDKEKWDYKYVNLIKPSGEKYTITILFYSSGEDVDRDFYRVMGDDFNPLQPASSQLFGFGYSLDVAIKRFLYSIDFVRAGKFIPADIRKIIPDEARRA